MDELSCGQLHRVSHGAVGDSPTALTCIDMVGSRKIVLMTSAQHSSVSYEVQK